MHSFNDRFHLYLFLSVSVKTLNFCEPQNNMGTKKQEVLEGVFTKKRHFSGSPIFGWNAITHQHTHTPKLLPTVASFPFSHSNTQTQNVADLSGCMLNLSLKQIHLINSKKKKNLWRDILHSASVP